MGYEPTLPVPAHVRDAQGVAITDAVFDHFSPSLAAAKARIGSDLDGQVDPVLREAVRLRNARTLDCDF